jgi:hypothetical protein
MLAGAWHFSDIAFAHAIAMSAGEADAAELFSGLSKHVRIRSWLAGIENDDHA